jgi:uncharacterized membrane protein YedE/YeeE
MTDRDIIATGVGFFLASCLVAVIIVLAGGVGVAYFWNCFAPDLFGAAAATYRNGIGFVGLLVLVRQITPFTVGRSRD